jgi:GPH family glycoside/pentoside/hexuronide:cation symporter
VKQMTAPAAPLSLFALLCYGLFGLPLAMVALPIYVFVPQFYAQRSSLSLAAIGTVLLAARVLAAFIDPMLGKSMAQRGGAYARYIMLSLPLLLVGFGALFHPPPLAEIGALIWFLASLMLVYLGFGLAMIAHQSWGAALTQAPSARARVTAVREGCGLIGVIAAAGLTGVLGYDGLTLLFAFFLLGTAALLLLRGPRPAAVTTSAASSAVAGSMLAPLRGVRFRALFSVLIVSGVGAAIPATLFLFFAEDRLQLGSYAGLFLILYFGAAAASMPLWVVLARRHGEARAWGAGMLLSALVFVWAYGLGPGALLAFGVICLLSGVALGADLALPPALLAGVIAQAGHSGQHEAAYFGLWNWGVQLSLALAAGIALPLLGWLGYVPGSGADTQALVVAYALLPCGLKLLAAVMLWRAPLRDC